MRRILGFLVVALLLGCGQSEQATLLELPAMQVKGTVKEAPSGTVVLETEHGPAMLPRHLVEDRELVLGSRLNAELPAGRSELLVLNSDSALLRMDDDVVQVPVSFLRAQQLDDRPLRLVSPAGDMVERTLAQALAAALQDEVVFVSPAVRELDTLAFDREYGAVPLSVVQRLDKDRHLALALRHDEPELVLLPHSRLVGTRPQLVPGSLVMAMNQPQGVHLVDWRPGMFALEPTTLRGTVVENWNETMLLQVGDEMLLVPTRLAGGTDLVLGEALTVDVPAAVAVPLSIASEVLTLELLPVATPDQRLLVQLPPDAIWNHDTVYVNLQQPRQVLTLAQALKRVDGSDQVLLTLNPDGLDRELPGDRTVGSLLGFRNDQAVFLTNSGRLHVIPASVAQGHKPAPGRPVVFSPGRSGKTIVSFTPGHRKQQDLRLNLAERRDEDWVRESRKQREEQAREAQKRHAERAREAEKRHAEQAREAQKHHAERAREAEKQQAREAQKHHAERPRQAPKRHGEAARQVPKHHGERAGQPGRGHGHQGRGKGKEGRGKGRG